MSTFEGRSARALVVVDMQNGVLDGAHQRDRVVETVADLVTRARAAAVPVVWIQHHDDHLARQSPQWKLVDALGPIDTEPLVEKSYGDAFADTDLESTLAGLGVGEIVLVGAASEQCIRCTMHSAVIHGYDVSLVKGAHTTSDMSEYGLPPADVVVGFIDAIAEFGMEWPGRSGRSVVPAQVGF